MTNPTKRRSELASLTGVFWAHLREHPTLPDPCTVTLNPWGPEVEVQVAPAGPVAHLGGLLLWACTLDGVTARWWHTRHDDLHISLRGRVAGARFKVYGGIPYAACAGLVPLDVDAKESVSIDEIYTLRALLTDQADPPEVVA